MCRGAQRRTKRCQASTDPAGGLISQGTAISQPRGVTFTRVWNPDAKHRLWIQSGPCQTEPCTPSAQLANRKDRIQMLCSLETISRKVTAAILNLDSSLRQSMTKVV